MDLLDDITDVEAPAKIPPGDDAIAKKLPRGKAAEDGANMAEGDDLS